ncbi:hypothetical protein ACFSSA_01055 [Luteolibacter algae]|uniref:Zinc-finger domain-containing protein n=1 Tax=Luteolibacter algae TaxID=454151 RepID=A0ABW5D3J0_9BACT
MNLSSDQINGLVKLIGNTREEERTCDECLESIAVFAENELLNRPVPDALKAVEHHISICAECCEEYEVLLAALSGLREDV